MGIYLSEQQQCDHQSTFSAMQSAVIVPINLLTDDAQQAVIARQCDFTGLCKCT